MKPHLKKSHIAVSIAAAAVITTAVVHAHRIGPAYLYPDPKLTPGKIDTQTIEVLISKNSCGTYSQCHRQTTDDMKTQVRNEYPSCPTGPKESEIDHVVPLALGGADDVNNLWCQPAENDWNGQNWGFHTKDALETYLAEQMKAVKISPKDAQNCILTDWVACYEKYLGQPGTSNLGADPDNSP